MVFLAISEILMIMASIPAKEETIEANKNP